MFQIELSAPVNNLCDYTFDFCWHSHRLDPDTVIPHQNGTEHTYRTLVDELKKNVDIHIKGDVGERFAQTMGVDIRHLGGTGNVEITGRIFVDGNVGREAGMGMVAGSLYISGQVEYPLGNIIEVHSDISGYHKFVSITDLLCNHLDEVPVSNSLDSENTQLVLNDGILRGTIGARCDCPCQMVVEGNTYNGTGLLMQQGTITITGDGGMNTGAHLNGGTVVVRGTADEFAGAYMKRGVLLIGDASGYVGADMEGGAIYSKKKITTSPPAEKTRITGADMSLIRKLTDAGRLESIRYSKYEVGESGKYVTVRMRDGSLVKRRVD